MTDTAEAPITHPEEMRAGLDLRIGKNINLKGGGRLTPAGIVTAGLMTVGVLLAAAALVREHAEYAPEPNPETKKKDVVWFALNDGRPLVAFAGLWTSFNGDRGTKSKPVPGPPSLVALPHSHSLWWRC
jgi:hypothetical protein